MSNAQKTGNARLIPVVDRDREWRRHALRSRVAQLRAQLQIEPELETHHALGEALAELRSFEGDA